MNHMENEPYRISANDLFAQIKELLAQIPPHSLKQTSLHTPHSSLLTPQPTLPNRSKNVMISSHVLKVSLPKAMRVPRKSSDRLFEVLSMR